MTSSYSGLVMIGVAVLGIVGSWFIFEGWMMLVGLVAWMTLYTLIAPQLEDLVLNLGDANGAE